MTLTTRSRRPPAAVAAAAVIFSSLVTAAAQATPSSTIWTNMTPDIQPYGVVHLGADNYTTAFRKTDQGGGSFATDYGVTVGVLPLEKLQMELGVDLIEATDHPLFFNLKMGAPEGALFAGAPALQVGIFNVGTEKGVTDQNVVDLVVGKSFANVGRFSAGPYWGNEKVLVDGAGRKRNTGYMVAFDRGFHAVEGAGGEFNRFVVAADYASGENALGGGSVGLYTYFTKDVSLLVGHVWFNDERVNGKPKWTVQLDVNLPAWSK